MALSIARVQRRTHEVATIIDAPESCLPTMGHTERFARPPVEFVGLLLHYVVVECGLELLRGSFQELEELLFRVFKDVTFQMTATFELRDRRIARSADNCDPESERPNDGCSCSES
jgi:hypothetical protein